MAAGQQGFLAGNQASGTPCEMHFLESPGWPCRERSGEGAERKRGDFLRGPTGEREEAQGGGRPRMFGERGELRSQFCLGWD